MLILVHLLPALGSAAAPPPPPPRPPAVAVGREAGPLTVAPTARAISEIEMLARSIPWTFEPDGRLRTPTVEVSDLECVSNGPRHFWCHYQVRSREFGAATFGPWQEKGKIFTRIEGEWAMLNAESQCAQLPQSKLPDYCPPAR